MLQNTSHVHKCWSEMTEMILLIFSSEGVFINVWNEKFNCANNVLLLHLWRKPHDCFWNVLYSRQNIWANVMKYSIIIIIDKNMKCCGVL